MVRLEHGIKIDGSQYLTVMSGEETDELQAHWNECEGVNAIYTSNKVLFAREQNTLSIEISDNQLYINNTDF